MTCSFYNLSVGNIHRNDGSDESKEEEEPTRNDYPNMSPTLEFDIPNHTIEMSSDSTTPALLLKADDDMNLDRDIVFRNINERPRTNIVSTNLDDVATTRLVVRTKNEDNKQAVIEQFSLFFKNFLCSCCCPNV